MSDKMYPMLINGEQRSTKKSIDVINPATGTVLGCVAQADADTMQQVLKAAQEGFHVWSATTPAERNAVILP